MMVMLLLAKSFVDRNTQTELVRIWLHIISAAILVVYLYLPHLQKRLGNLYLPLALGFATVGPLASLYFPLVGTSIEDIDLLEMLLASIRLFLVWIVVVVMLGWAYNLRVVWTYSISIVILNMLIPWQANVIPNDLLFEYGIFNLSIIVPVVLIGYLATRLSAAGREQRQKLAAANAKLVQYANALEDLTISRERNRMARELHDTLAHTLSGLAVQLETTKAFMDSDQSTAKSLLEQSLTATRDGLQETRLALQALRATPLEDLGLRMALIQLAESAAQRTGVKLTLDVANDIPALSPEIEQTLYRTAQEAIANVVKHATAQILTLKVTVNGTITLIVADDGVGFDADGERENGRFGLIGMQERAALVGGEFILRSQPGQGTQVKLTIDLERS